MGDHLIDGEFQSDKYPSTPRGFVPLKVTDKVAQPLLYAYAQVHRAIDAEFSADLVQALRIAGYDPTLCIACEKPLVDGDKYYPDHNNGGALHAACCGPERECFTDSEGEPLKDGEPIPDPLTWTEGPTHG